MRESSCLRCHAAIGDRDTMGPSAGTVARDIPGLFARSVVVTDDGEPLPNAGSQLVDEIRLSSAAGPGDTSRDTPEQRIACKLRLLLRARSTFGNYRRDVNHFADFKLGHS